MKIQDFKNYNELRAHYLAVRQRLGGLGKSPGLVPIADPEKPKIVAPVVERASKSVFDLESIPKNKFRQLLMDVANKYNIDPLIILEPNRRANIIKIRREFVYQAVKELKYSASRVGHWMHRDHKTILHDIQMYEQTNAPVA